MLAAFLLVFPLVTLGMQSAFLNSGRLVGQRLAPRASAMGQSFRGAAQVSREVASKGAKAPPPKSSVMKPQGYRPPPTDWVTLFHKEQIRQTYADMFLQSLSHPKVEAPPTPPASSVKNEGLFRTLSRALWGPNEEPAIPAEVEVEAPAPPQATSPGKLEPVAEEQPWSVWNGYGDVQEHPAERVAKDQSAPDAEERPWTIWNGFGDVEDFRPSGGDTKGGAAPNAEEQPFNTWSGFGGTQDLHPSDGVAKGEPDLEQPSGWEWGDLGNWGAETGEPPLPPRADVSYHFDGIQAPPPQRSFDGVPPEFYRDASPLPIEGTGEGGLDLYGVPHDPLPPIPEIPLPSGGGVGGGAGGGGGGGVGAELATEAAGNVAVEAATVVAGGIIGALLG